jgi:hypothetical protein
MHICIQPIGSIREVARVLGVDMKNIKKGVERCMMLDTSQNAFWMDCGRLVEN